MNPTFIITCINYTDIFPKTGNLQSLRLSPNHPREGHCRLSSYPDKPSVTLLWIKLNPTGLGINTSRLRQNDHDFADDIFQCIFLNENCCIIIKISLKFVHKYPINNIPSLVQIMAWSWPGAKPLTEPMMVSLLTHICAIRPEWVNME